MRIQQLVSTFALGAALAMIAAPASGQTGRSAKKSLKRGSSSAHHELTKTGKAAKEELKKP
jgi:hypothetical protein